MFCPNCGKEVSSGASFCEHCGSALNSENTTQVDNTPDIQAQVNGQNVNIKTGIGFVLGFFLGLIGLIIGFSMFKEGTLERKTFLKGWWIAFAINVVLSMLSSILMYSGVISLPEYYY